MERVASGLEPLLGGGIQHVEDCFHQYLKRDDHNVELLIDYAIRRGNGAVFKRLGFLAERIGCEKLVELCSKNMSSGNTILDSSLDCSKLVTRWRLFVPTSWISRS